MNIMQMHTEGKDNSPKSSHMISILQENKLIIKGKRKVQISNIVTTGTNMENCNFQNQTGRKYKYEHEKAPPCKFQAKCNRENCMFSLSNQNAHFLAQTSRQFQPPPPHPFHGFWPMFPNMMNQFPFPGQMRGYQ